MKNQVVFVYACIRAFTTNPTHFLLVKLINFCRCSRHFPRSSADFCHDAQCAWAAYLRNSSSHRNQRVLPGLRMRKEAGNSCSDACQSESLHPAALDASRSLSILTTCLAQHHLRFRCSSCQKRMPDSLAVLKTLRVERLIQSSQSSSGRRRAPAKRRSIAFCVDCNNRFSD